MKYYYLIVICLMSVSGFSQIPAISSVTPSEGDTAVIVTISGTNFSSVADENLVFFRNAKAQVLSASTDNLTVKVPVGAVTGKITVTVNNLTAESSQIFKIRFNGADIISDSYFSEMYSYNISPLTTDFFPYTGRAADFNLDGWPDVAVASQKITFGDSTRQVMILENVSPNSDTLAFSNDLRIDACGYWPKGMDVADFDMDGMTDFVITTTTEFAAEIFRNNGTIGGPISFEATSDHWSNTYHTGQGPMGITHGDLNSDGKPDMAVACFLDGVVTILINESTPGNLSFNRVADIPAPFAESVVIADLDNNGEMDVLTAANADYLSVFSDTVSGTGLAFGSALQIPCGPTGKYITAADFNDDGKIDLAVANAGTMLSQMGVSVLINTSTPGNISFDPYVKYATQGRAITVTNGDFNGDGKIDIAATTDAMDGKILKILQNRCAGSSVSFNLVDIYSYGCMAPDIYVTDINNDMLPDILHSDITLYSSFELSLNHIPSQDSIDLLIQEFAPTGAQWHYEVRYLDKPDLNYVCYTVSGDTIIQEKICRKIVTQYPSFNPAFECINEPIVTYLYSSNDTVYFYDAVSMQFQNMYIFNADVSDSWYYTIHNGALTDTVRFTVTGVDSIIVHRFEYKKLNVDCEYISATGTFQSEGYLIEHMGLIQYGYDYDPYTSNACDSNYISHMRCYYDPVAGEYQTNISPYLCGYTYTIGIDELIKGNSYIRCYPNPAADRIFVECNDGLEVNEVYLTNKLGEKIKNFTPDTTVYDVSDIENGTYFLTFKTSVGKITKKVSIVR